VPGLAGRKRAELLGLLRSCLAAVATAATLDRAGPSRAIAAKPGYGQAQPQQDTDAIRALGVSGVQARVTTSRAYGIAERVHGAGRVDSESFEPVGLDGYVRESRDSPTDAWRHETNDEIAH
jgi:D-alanyl-D-alanine carboxypeptidase